MNLTPVFECLEDRLEETLDGKDQHYGRFSLGPINRGQGFTIGNSLRRTLLSDLNGLAITSAKFSNIKFNKELPGEVTFFEEDEKIHEYSSIPGMRESIFEILLNLREIVISKKIESDQFDTQTCFLAVSGSGIVNADSIEWPPNINLVNRNQYITTVVDPRLSFDLEMTIEEGSGASLPKTSGNIYKLNKSLPVEPNFMIIKKVNYIVEEYKLPSTEEIEDFKKERILLEVWTNGSLDPRKAVKTAAQILTNLFAPFIQIEIDKPDTNIVVNPIVLPSQQQSSNPQTIVIQPHEMELTKTQIDTKTTLIEELDLSVRSYNCLKRAQLHTIADLLDYSVEDLLELKNFGLKSADEVVEALQNRFDLQLPKKNS